MIAQGMSRCETKPRKRKCPSKAMNMPRSPAVTSARIIFILFLSALKMFLWRIYASMLPAWGDSSGEAAPKRFAYSLRTEHKTWAGKSSR
jgi:hypothetical protein